MLLRGLLLVLLTLAALLQDSAAGLAAQKSEKKDEAKKEPAAAAATAAPATETTAPYDERLVRLAEILGSVHYLRNLCNGQETQWRQMMRDLLAEETRNEPKRSAMLTAGFNRGYRSFAATYTKCTAQAIAAEEKYRAEGATLATEITARFGN